MKIVSWNVNGLRAVAKKGLLLSLIQEQEPDLLFLMETKCEHNQIDESITEIKGYRMYLIPSQAKKGHSGTALYIRETIDHTLSYDEELLPYLYDIEQTYQDAGYADIAHHTPKGAVIQRVTRTIAVDALHEHLGGQEGRLITCVTPKVVLVGCYVPNGGDRKGMNGLQYKLEYYDALLLHVKRLQQTHDLPIVFIGDVNIAHAPIDLARPESNKYSIGCLPIERSKLDAFVDAGWTDVYRTKHPDTAIYSWWDVITRARERNVGWRIDSAWVQQLYLNKTTVTYLTEHMGSDHCPVVCVVN